MIITTIIATENGSTNWSACDIGVGVGAIVDDGALMTVNADVALDGQ